jgi:hypothetical protein
MLKQ